MNHDTIWPFIGRTLAACTLCLMLPFAQAEESTRTNTEAPHQVAAPAAMAVASEIAQLKAMLLAQQRQIDELRREVAQQRNEHSAPAVTAGAAVDSGVLAVRPNLGEVASLNPVVPLGMAASLPVSTAASLAALAQAPPAAAPVASAASVNAVQKAVEAINANLRGFRLSGDLRFRSDTLIREANTSLPPGDNRAVPAQRARERYRFRLNIDKDLFFSDKSDRPMAHAHVQLATDPFNNPSTMDTDFTGISTRAPISIAEAYMDFMPLKSLTLRIGRTSELFADNRQYVYDDDIRFNGFHETYRWAGKQNGLFVQLAAAQYILTDPNVQVLPAGSPYLAAGYSVGQRVPSSNLFDQGITVGSNLGKKWSHNETFNYFTVREPNQIQLASTAGGAALFANSAVLGATLIGNLPETGNATTTPGGATYFAKDFHVLRGAFNLNYSGGEWNGHKFPVQFFVQGTHNTGASIENNGYMLGASVGQAAKFGDFQLQYQYFKKPANGFISQFTDDDVGSGSGVNLKNNQIRINFGLTRFLAWENRLYIQQGLAVNNPGINFFVPFQQGYKTQYRIHSQFVFTF